MLEIVVKRDGREVNFDIDKIKTALKKAFAEVDQTDIDDVCDDDATNKLIDKIANEIAHGGNKKMSVEQIQDIVESKLMCSHRKDVAKAYILYRNERTKIRNNNSEFMKVISEKLMASNVQNQNANVDEHSFGGRKGEADSELMRRYALDNCMSEMAKMNHLNNKIYIHDLDSYAVGMHNCLSIPFDDLLAKGFNTRQTDVRPAKSINTALQLVAVISQLQSLQQFGGVSATHLDWTLVPYFRMSLFKHYLMNYVEDTDDFLSLDLVSMDEEEIDDLVDAHKEKYLSEMGLTSEDFYIGNDKLDKRLYQRALLETRKETYQAIEGLYHNLNELGRFNSDVKNIAA